MYKWIFYLYANIVRVRNYYGFLLQNEYFPSRLSGLELQYDYYCINIGTVKINLLFKPYHTSMYKNFFLFI